MRPHPPRDDGEPWPDFQAKPPAGLFHRTYYHLKPWMPCAARNALRRIHARVLLRRHGRNWPVLPSSSRPPEGWAGWPGGKPFAFVITHDVEGQRGLDQCQALAELDLQYGFRSSFNFVPEGEYRVPETTRRWFANHDLEVGVHDLNHDGKLFTSREVFRGKAARINRYLEEWGAAGFRAAFMFHQLEWQHDLNVLYDASTFDTDPFEPQPDGVGTIFPFCVRASHNGHGVNGRPKSPGANGSHAFAPAPGRPPKGIYVELPYTLPQDSTLFIVLGHRSTDLWKRKLDWIVQHGGLALVNVHPDYLRFDSRTPQGKEFASALYRDFLAYVRQRYGEHLWQPLPRELATLVLEREIDKTPF